MASLPVGSVPMQKQRIAVYGDAGVRHALETLGFDIVVTRTLSRNGAVQEREEIFTRYEATPEVVCTG